MNKDMEVKKRDWVKNAAIVFLIVMLALTLFSNTILNASLPEVAAQYTQSATITSRIRGSGTVMANEEYEVMVSQAFTVSEVRAKVGDLVEAGDVLIVLTQDASTELESTREALRLAELERERFLVSDSPDNNYGSYNRAIQSARSALDDEKDRLELAEDELDNAEDELKYAKNTLEKARKEQTEAIANFSSAAHLAVQAEIDRLNGLIDIATISEESARNSLETYIELNGGLLWVNRDEEEYIDLATALNDAMSELSQAKVNLAEYLVSPAAVEQASAAARMDSANTWVSSATADVSSAESNIITANEKVLSAKRSILTAQQNLDAANEALTEAIKSGGKTNSLFDIELREKNRNIEALKEKLEELEESGTLSEITAATGGKIKQVSISPGQQTIPDSPFVVIEIIDRGYTLSIPVTSEQSSRVNIGDTAEVDRGWWSWGEPLTAILTNIRPDPQNPAGGRLLVFSVSGDVESGTQLNVTIAQRSENYGIVVPNSAIRSDTNGDFVLLVETRPSPLRNRYIATRVDVTILATDDVNSAISGAGLGGWDFIITTATRPIEPGMQVRLVDNT